MSKSQAPESITSAKPRRIYPYKGRALVCFVGQRFQSPEDSAINPDFPANKIEVASENAKTAQVTQRRKGKKGVTETWSLFRG